MPPGSAILGTVFSGGAGQAGGAHHRAGASEAGTPEGGIVRPQKGAAGLGVEGTDSGLGFSFLSDPAWV